MKRPQRETRLRLDILRLLDSCEGYMLPESTLHGHLMLLSAPPPAEEEIFRTLQTLKSQSLVLTVSSSLSGEAQWKLTDRGRALLVEYLHL